MVCLTTVVEPVLPEGLMVDQLDLPTLVSSAIDHGDDARVLAVSVYREVKWNPRAIHAGLGEVETAFPCVEHEPFICEARDHPDSLAVRVVLGASGEGEDSKDEGQEETNTVHRCSPVSCWGI